MTTSPMRYCPVCRRGWPEGSRQICPDDLVDLVADPDATTRCRQCGHVCPATMQSCPACLAELRPDADVAAASAADLLARGVRLPRPAGVAAFSRGVDVTLGRAAARAPLVFSGPDGLLEATVRSPDRAAAAPLDCCDLDGSRLFRLERYAASDRPALVATDAGGTSLTTFLRMDGAIPAGLHVRDETSAPVARLLRRRDAENAGWQLVETGGAALADVDVVDHEFDDATDDEWSLHVLSADRLPLRRLAAVALLLAAKCLLGRTAPTPKATRRSVIDDDDDPLLDIDRLL